MQDSQVGISSLVQSPNGCIRCHGAPVVDWNLCERCLSTFSRFKLDRGGSNRDISVEEFIKLMPLRNTRRQLERMMMSMPSTEPVPGFMVFGPVMADLVEKIRKVAKSDLPVLVQGETGVGKELVAKAIHMLSARRTKLFVPVNSATISSPLAESEMFGHERGSFTGAQHKTGGFFQDADGGTMFLDEIVDMPLQTQAKLMRVLQDGEVRSVGSSKIKYVDVRMISAANRDVWKMCKAGDFREDLFHRLGIVLNVPSLRERKEEIPQLAQYLANKIAKKPVSIDDHVISAFMSYDWPGNIRELEKALREGVLYSEGEVIQTQHIPRHVLSGESRTLTVANLMDLGLCESSGLNFCLNNFAYSILLRYSTSCVLILDKELKMATSLPRRFKVRRVLVCLSDRSSKTLEELTRIYNRMYPPSFIGLLMSEDALLPILEYTMSKSVELVGEDTLSFAGRFGSTPEKKYYRITNKGIQFLSKKKG